MKNIRRRVHAPRFRRVDFILRSGDRVTLAHPEQVAMTKDGFIVVIDPEPHGSVWEFWAAEVAALRVPRRSRGRSGNGRRG